MNSSRVSQSVDCYFNLTTITFRLELRPAVRALACSTATRHSTLADCRAGRIRSRHSNFISTAERASRAASGRSFLRLVFFASFHHFIMDRVIDHQFYVRHTHICETPTSFVNHFIDGSSYYINLAFTGDALHVTALHTI